VIQGQELSQVKMLTTSLILSALLWNLSEYLYSLATKLEGALILLVAVADSSFLSIPEGNDLLIVILSAGKPWGRMFVYVLLTIVGSVVGCSLLYSVGKRGGNPILRRAFSESAVQRTERFFARFGTLGLFIPSILPPPCPFKIFVLSAGVFRLDKLKFLAAVTLGRTIRYSTWGILAVLYGEPVRVFMQENARKAGVVLLAAFVLIVVMVFVVSIRRRTERGDQG
jgi:membrane protein YqaA with SNARE-associated domain